MPDTADDVPTTEAHRSRYLRIYLNDHLMGATGGVALARRCQHNNLGTPLGDFLEQLIGDVSADRDALIRVITALELPVDRAKVALGEIGEKLGRLKLNGSVLRYSDLSRLVEVESLCAAVDIKKTMWRNLAGTIAGDPRLAGIDLDQLIRRAEAQRAALEDHRLAAAERAFGHGAG